MQCVIVFHRIYLEFNTDDYLSVGNMREMKMMIETRPSYPSDKLTLNVADLTKDRVIKFFYFNLFLNLNEKYDVNLVLEDSKRNFMNSF